jgi:hypothetical protein
LDSLSRYIGTRSCQGLNHPHLFGTFEAWLDGAGCFSARKTGSEALASSSTS